MKKLLIALLAVVGIGKNALAGREPAGDPPGGHGPGPHSKLAVALAPDGDPGGGHGPGLAVSRDDGDPGGGNGPKGSGDGHKIR